MKFKIEELKSFTVMPNYHLRDKRLSLKAKGLLSIMYSLPNEWDYTMNGLCTITNTGITAIRNIIAEIELNGYLKREQYRNEKGQINYTYIVKIEPSNKKQNYKDTISYKRLKQSLSS